MYSQQQFDECRWWRCWVVTTLKHAKSQFVKRTSKEKIQLIDFPKCFPLSLSPACLHDVFWFDAMLWRILNIFRIFYDFLYSSVESKFMSFQLVRSFIAKIIQKLDGKFCDLENLQPVDDNKFCVYEIEIENANCSPIFARPMTCKRHVGIWYCEHTKFKNH